MTESQSSGQTSAVSPLVRRAAPPDAGEALRLVGSPERLKAVEQSGLLNSGPEEAFDALTRLAARLLQVPVSFVSIVDVHRDYVKSQFGFPEVIAAARELTGQSFCHFALASDELLVIDDTHSNPVWQAVPAVTSLGVRAYVGVPLRLYGHVLGTFCVADMRPRQWSEHELEVMRELGLSARRELELRASLQAARDEADNARGLARAREEMVAVVAHDLRTPLQILQLSAALLQRDPNSTQQALVGRIATAVAALSEMANSLLAASSVVPAADARLRPCTAAALLIDAVDMMAPIAERADIALAVGELAGSSVMVDYAQMLRALGNLIGNAIKYSPAGSRVTLSARNDAVDVAISVTDTGRGMTAQEQGQAFNKGWQGTDGMVRGDGAGLGLSIVKKLIEAHRGRVELASEPGVGTVMTIFLPRH
ncbi:MAG: GAF domain-containing sensor histidine kinase [Polaromonas sp.]|nr:GAF domain-containing sensor histidine kinase [Polaromonas sp.]